LPLSLDQAPEPSVVSRISALTARRPAPAMRRGRSASMVPALLLTACGGGGGSGHHADWLHPLWVPTDVAFVDVDRDGRADILTPAQFVASPNQREGHLIVPLQSSPGVFTAVQTAIVGEYPWRLAAGDIDGDGVVDVAVVDVAGSRGVRVLLQDHGDCGRLPEAREVTSGVSAYEVAMADLNGDRRPILPRPTAKRVPHTWSCCIRTRRSADHSRLA